MRLPGGGCTGAAFVDVSGPTRQEWSNSAPDWRMASPGLCLEGVCTKQGCSAYKNHVIMNHGFTSFDLIEDGYSCECPKCASPVVPTTCAFTNCKWKWVGKKIDPRTRRPVVLRSNGWNTADDAYHRFDEDTSGSVNWLHLKITTKDPARAHIDTCVVCSREIFESSTGRIPGHGKALECGHKFHYFCNDNWLSVNSTCPLCRAQSHMMAFQRKEAGLVNRK